MNAPATLTEAPFGTARRYTLTGGILGALQPPLLAVLAVWMNSYGVTGETPNPFIAGVLAGWRSILPCAVLGALVGKLTHAARVKFGRDAVLPIVMTYAFLSTALLLFLFLMPE